MSLGSCGEDFLYKAPQGSVDENALTNANGVDLLVTNTVCEFNGKRLGRICIQLDIWWRCTGGDANKDRMPMTSLF